MGLYQAWFPCMRFPAWLKVTNEVPEKYTSLEKNGKEGRRQPRVHVPSADARLERYPVHSRKDAARLPDGPQVRRTMILLSAGTPMHQRPLLS